MILLIRPTLRINEKRPSLPLSLINLSSYLDSKSIQNDILDLDLIWQKTKNFNKVGAHFSNVLADRDYKYFGISVNDANLIEGLYWVERIREIKDNAIIIFGGPGVTFNSVEILEKFNHLIDIIVRNEGEITLYELLSRLTSNPTNVIPVKTGIQSYSDLLSGIKGITYYDGRDVVRNEDRELIENLDELPFPNYDKINIKEYFARRDLELFQIFVGSGCNHNCNFCSTAKFWKHRVRYKSPLGVIEEITHIQERYQINDFELIHDNIFANSKFVNEFSKELVNKQVNILWAALGRIDDVNYDTLDLIEKAGCQYLFFGIETIAHSGQLELRKKINLSDIKDKIKYLKNSKIKSIYSFIYDYPKETYDDFNSSLNFALQNMVQDNCLVTFNRYVLLSGQIPSKTADYKLDQLFFNKTFYLGEIKCNIKIFGQIFLYFYRTSEKNSTSLQNIDNIELNDLFESFKKTLSFIVKLQNIKPVELLGRLTAGDYKIHLRNIAYEHKLTRAMFNFENYQSYYFRKYLLTKKGNSEIFKYPLFINNCILIKKFNVDFSDQQNINKLQPRKITYLFKYANDGVITYKIENRFYNFLVKNKKI